MKKLVVGLLAALMLGSFVNQVLAQNLRPVVIGYNILGPGVCSNSSGVYYGCIQNTGPNQWSLGASTAPLLGINGPSGLTWGVSGSSVIVTLGGSLSGSAALVVQSTSSTQANAALQVTDNNGVVSFQVLQSGGVTFRSRTKAQLLVQTPAVSGEHFICSNCSNVNALYVATGTAVNQWREQGTATGVQ